MHLIVPTRSGLPPAEHSFCHYLAADPQMNATEAYLKVRPNVKRHSAEKLASKWCKRPEIREYIGVLLETRQKRLEIDEDWVMSSLRDIHDRCMQAEPVYDNRQLQFDEDGEPVEREPLYFKFDANGALKALELMGRHMRMFSDKVDVAQMNVSMKLNLGGDENPAIEGDFKRVGNG